ncbi:MAG TPA: pentapeptide repeat-containing protein [Rubrobacter sp.]|nr:pentapeptide repeat-containing protein [Rubrobacter sp.]
MKDSKPSSPSEERQDEKWYDRTRYLVLFFVGGIALFGLVMGLILDWYIDPQTSTQKKDLVQALGLITAGVAGAVGIFFTWRGQRLAREAQEDNQRNTQEQLRLSRQTQEQNQKSTQVQLENAQEELRLTRQGQITERFTRAIDQLGSEKLEIRLGSIYALERIDKESPERAYHGTVMEVLTAYVRVNSRSRWEPEEASTPTSASSLEDHTDSLAILDVLKRREEERVPEAHHVRINLSRAHLQRAYFQGADLQGANFAEANLQDAYLKGAYLKGASLHEANLQGAYLQGASLQGARYLLQWQIEWTVGSNETSLPDSLNRPEWWSYSIEEQKKIIRERLSR